MAINFVVNSENRQISYAFSKFSLNNLISVSTLNSSKYSFKIDYFLELKFQQLLKYSRVSESLKIIFYFHNFLSTLKIKHDKKDVLSS